MHEIPISQQSTVFNEAQLELLDMMSHINSENTLKELRLAISNFFAQKAEEELDKMWADGTLNEEKVESFRYLHERTPYKE